MRSRIDKSLWEEMRRGVLAIAMTFIITACSTAPATKPVATKASGKSPAREAPHVEVLKDETGFSINEEVRVSNEMRTDYDNAVRLLAQKQYGQGIELLSKLVQSAPNVTAFHIDLGIAYGLSGDLDHAEASLKEALELNPKQPVAYNELGLVYRKKGQFAAARGSYEKALALYPEFHYARRNLAVLCDIYLADLNCALEHYEAYHTAVPDDGEAEKWLADVRNRAKKG